MGLPPKNKKHGQNGSSDGSPKKEEGHHRIEAKVYAFLSLWIFADFLVIFGHISIAAWVFYFVLVFGLGLFTHHAIKGWPPRKRVFSWVYAASCVALPLLLFMLSRQTAESKPHAHFTFSLFLDSAPDDLIDLTNDFLRITNFSDNELIPVKLTSVLLMQRQPEQSNTVLRLIIKNDSSVDAQSPEVTITFEQDWRCLPDSAWLREKRVSSGNFLVGETSPGVFSTNSLQRWLYPIPSEWLLRGNSDMLPPFQIAQLSYPSGIILMARSVGSPANAIGFNLLFPSQDAPFVVRKPFLMLATNMEHGQFKVSISPEKFNELVKLKFISPK